MVAIASAIRPPPPRPWTARNAISCSMFWEKPGEQRTDEERDDGDLEEQPPAVEVGDLAPQRRRGGRGEEVRRHDPGQLVEAAELGGDPGERRTDDALVQRGQEHADHQAAHDHEDLLVGQVALCVGGHEGSSWLVKSTDRRCSRTRSVSRSDSGQSAMTSPISARRRRPPSSRARRPCGLIPIWLARPSSGSSVRSTRPRSCRVRTCRLTVEASRWRADGQRGQAHRALRGEVLEQGHRREVELVAGQPLAQASADAHGGHQHRLLGGGRLGRRAAGLGR